MAWSPEISQLSTDVTQLTDAVNVKKNQLSGAVTSAQTSKASANTSAGLAESGAVLSAASMQTANTHKNSTLSVYGTQAVQQASIGTATTQASAAATSAATATAGLTQDLSGVTAQALHRSPNAVTSMFVYDTSKDSDGGAWTEKCQHTSWYNESIMGKWLGPQPSELEARHVGATLGNELVTNGNFSSGITGWSIVGDVVATDGGLRMFNSTGQRPVITQSFPTIAGRSYKVTYNADVFSGGQVNCVVRNTSDGVTLISPNTGTGIFTATSTSTEFFMRSNNTTIGSGLFLDNVSIKEVIALNTVSSDYYQLITDGKFYRLWKNLFKWSEQINDTVWQKVGVPPTITDNFATGPNGTPATRLQFSTAGPGNRINQLVSGTGGTRTLSFRMKGETGGEQIGVWDGWNSLNTTITLTTSWQQFTFTYVASNASTGLYIYAVSGTPTVQITEIQHEFGTITTAYEPKTTIGTTSEVFRGNKRDFPRLAAVVNEVNGITIYDLTEPGRPMWKVFRTHNFSLASSYEHTLHVSRGTLASASGIAGLVCVGSTTLGGGNPVNGGGLHVFDFPQDRIYSRIGFYGGDTGRMITMNQYSTVDSSTAGYRHNLPGIASIAVNAIAMTVLPDAPTDPATGLRVPTIAVGTASGISVIKHNGTVVTGSAPNSFTSVSISTLGVFAQRASSIMYYAFGNPNNFGAGFTLSLSQNTFPDFQQNNSVVNYRAIVGSQKVDVVLAPTQNRAGYNRLRMSTVDFNRSITNVVTNTFNTGWLPGDIRRAYLSEAEEGHVAGTELLTNGDFSNGTTGWTALQAATLSVSDGVLRVTNIGGNFGQAGSSFIPTTGKTYEISATLVAVASGRVGRLAFGGVTLSQSIAVGTHTYISTAVSATSLLLYSSSANAADWSEWDNISVREVVADRSYKAARAKITGTLTKSQLASGTSLVGYSGFSTSNYLREPYSADLDFGTGELSVSAWVNIPVTLPDSSFSISEGVERVTSQVAANYGSGTVTNNGGLARATATSTSTVYGLNFPSGGLKPAGRYRVTFEIVEAVNSGGLTVHAGDGNIGIPAGSSPGVVTLFVNNLAADFFMVIRGNAPAGAYFSVRNVSFIELGPALIADRRHSSGSRLRLGINGVGRLVATAFDGTTTRTVTTTAAYNNAQWLKAEACYTTDGSLAIRVNGREVAVTRGTPLLSLNSRRNLILYSEQFNVTTNGWTTSAASIGASVTAPIGTETAQTLAESAVGSIWHGVSQQWAAPVVATVTYSTYAKASTRRYAYLQLGDGSSPRKRYSALFDLESGTFVSANGLNSPTGTNYQISSAGNGWYRLSVTMTLTGLTSGVFTSIGISNTATPTWSSVNYVDYTGDGASAILIWGAQLELGSTTTNYQRVGIATDFDFQAPVTIGNSFATDAPFPGSIALLKLGATVPTPEQSVFMYEQEKQLFRPGALSVLPDANAIVDMSYDDATDRWAAVSTTNESYWNGLVRTSATAVPAGTYSKVATTSGVELVSRTTTNPGVDVSIPPYALREELVKKSEAASRLSRKTVTYDFTGGFTGNITTGSTSILSVAGLVYPMSYIGARISGTGIPANTTITGVSGTTIYISAPATATTSTLAITFIDFNLPVGMEAKVVLTAGVIKREGSTSDYTRLFDGFIETIRFAVAPGSTAWVQIQATRTTQ